MGAGTVVPDATSDDTLANVLGLQPSMIGSYVVVPLVLAEGSLYGLLAGINRRPDPDLGDVDLRAMRIVAELLGKVIPEDRRRTQLKSDVSDLIASADFKMAYQPVFNILTKKCIGLKRWPGSRARKGQLRIMSSRRQTKPDSEPNLNASRVFLAQANSPLLAEEQFLAANLSPDALIALAEDEQAAALLSRGDFVVELTEHDVVDSYDNLQAALAPLRSKGMRLAVDDAGSGYVFA